MVWIFFKMKNNLARSGLKEYMSYGYSNNFMSKNYLK